MDSKILIDFLKQAKDKGLKAITAIGSGEPLFHPKSDYLIKEIGKIGLKQGMFTNGTLLGEKNFEAILENLTFLRVSLDAATPETHLKLHGGPNEGFQNAIEGLEYLATNRRDKFPTLGIQFITSQYNLDEATKAAKLAKDTGIDYIAFKPLMKNPLNSKHDKNVLVLNNELIDTFEELKEFSDENFKVYVKEEQLEKVLQQEVGKKDYDVCLGHPISPSLYGDGTLWLCCNIAGHPGFNLGNIYESSFEKIWNSEKREKAIQSIDLSKCPSACRLNPLNEILYGLTIKEAEKKIKEVGEPNPEMHPDFI
jgi:MoaA/NifB/PqqE/SkfB family radical SAM enzyme